MSSSVYQFNGNTYTFVYEPNRWVVVTGPDGKVVTDPQSQLPPEVRDHINAYKIRC